MYEMGLIFMDRLKKVFEKDARNMLSGVHKDTRKVENEMAIATCIKHGKKAVIL